MIGDRQLICFVVIMLSENDIHEFIALYEAETSIKLEPELAEDKASKLIRLVKVLIRDLKEKKN